MRLFIAIDLPEEIKEYLNSIQDFLPQAEMRKTHDFHLTLKFLGHCDENRLEKIKSELAKIHFVPFEVELGKVGVFGGGSPRVVWVGVKVPQSVFELAREIEEKMAGLGFEKENRFAPHITLARIKFIRDKERFLRDLGKITAEPKKFQAQKFYLFESRLSRTGAVYAKLAQFPSAKAPRQ